MKPRRTLHDLALADLWRAGKIRDAAAYLSTHYNTADGRKVAGLVRRREAEARLFEHGDYGDSIALEGEKRISTPTPSADADPVVKEAQEILTAQGFIPGAIDGWMGAKTRAAVLAYQRAHPDLIADGIIGPATMAQLRRDAAAVKDTATAVANASIDKRRNRRDADMKKLFSGDNLTSLRDNIASESVDLVYLDPPFNSQENYNVP